MPDTTSSLVVICLAYALFWILRFVIEEITSPLRELPGPPLSSYLFGNLKGLAEGADSNIQGRWTEKYGATMKYGGILGCAHLFTTDTKAIGHIITQNYVYQKPDVVTYNMKRILGEGILVVDGDTHKNQRRLINPAFGLAQIREFTEIFIEKSIQLRDIWSAELSDGASTNEGAVQVEALSWLNRMSLDIIGLAGFNYNFNALEQGLEKNALGSAWVTMIQNAANFEIIPVLRATFPFLRFLRTKLDEAADEAKAIMDRIGRNLLAESKASLVPIGYEGSVVSKDLLSLLVRANAALDLPHGQTLTDQVVLDQIATFLAAGHDTSSNAIAWCLYILTQHRDVQEKLREELLTITTDMPSLDELNDLSYLDAFVRETLRIYSPVPSTMRQAMEDDVLPLGEPVIGKSGKVLTEIQVKKGQLIFIPLSGVNLSKALWGSDAESFKPSRWEKLPDGVTEIPGIWANLMTFMGGPHACIGYRFAVMEIKAVIFTLLRSFEFELAVKSGDIRRKTAIVQRPMLATDNSIQLPLLVKSLSWK